MATSATTTDDAQTETNTPGITADDAITAAPALALNGVLKGRTLDELGDALNDDSRAFSALWAVYPTFPELADDEDDASEPGDRRAQSFLFAAALDSGDDSDDDRYTDTDPAIRITDEYENGYGDLKVAIETPEPWKLKKQAADPDVDEYDIGTEWGDDTHDVAVTPNAVIKALIWNEHHYNFHGADEPGRFDDQWTIDASGIDRLREAATDAGYRWEDDRGIDPETYLADDTPDGLDRVTAFAEKGDTVTIRYEKKSGNGIATKQGQVTIANTGEEESTYGTKPQRFVVKWDAPASNKHDRKGVEIKRDGGDQALFTILNSHAPYMGEPVSVEVDPVNRS